MKLKLKLSAFGQRINQIFQYHKILAYLLLMPNTLELNEPPRYLIIISRLWDVFTRWSSPKLSNIFSQIQSLVKATTDGSGAVVPGQGWLIYGGNDLSTSQKLVHINQAWTNGPDLPGRVKVTGTCVVQVRYKK